MYERAADSYAANRAAHLVPAASVLLTRLPLARARVVVDAGTGTGALIPRLRAAAPMATVIGLDLAAAMLGHAAKAKAVDSTTDGRTDGAEVGRVLFAQADLAHPPLAPECADVLVSAFVLFHLADPPAAVRALAGALRPGGMFAAATWARDPFWAAKAVLVAELDAAGAPLVTSTRFGAAFTESRQALADLVESAGLRVLDTEVAPLGGPIVDPADLVGGWTAFGSAAARFAALDRATQLRVRANAIARIGALPAEDRRDPHEVIRIWAVKPDRPNG
jgi:SAM-dependent methyltransferase